MNKPINRLKLAKVLRLYKETKVKDTVLVSEGEIIEETEVFVEDENGELVPAADGEYITEDEKTTYVVENGRVSAIRTAEEETEPEPEPEPMAEEETTEETTEETITEEPVPEVAENEELKAENEELKAKVEQLTAENAELKAEVETLKAKAEETEASAEETEKAMGFSKETREDRIARVVEVVKKHK